jgi:antitoxin component YwqK of YwqJK toxin-antitoxin module/Tfp pilus assembly protein PilF
MKKAIIFLFVVAMYSNAKAQTEIRKTYYESGKLKVEMPYVNGNASGVGKEYYESGKLKAETPFLFGEANGLAKEYYENGKISTELPYVNSKVNGVKKGYYESGKLQYEVVFENNNPKGISKRYYESGKLKAETPYVNGEVNGIVKEYYENGKISGELPFVDGKINGVVKGYYENGKLQSENPYKNGEVAGAKKYFEKEAYTAQQLEKTRQEILKCKGLSKAEVGKIIKTTIEGGTIPTEGYRNSIIGINYAGNQRENSGDLQEVLLKLNELTNTKSTKVEIEEVKNTYKRAAFIYNEYISENKIPVNSLIDGDAMTGYYYYKNIFDFAGCSFKQKNYKLAWEHYQLAAPYYLPDSSYYLSAVAMIKDNESAAKGIQRDDLSKMVVTAFNKAIQIIPSNKLYVGERGKFYLLTLKDTANALIDFNTAVKLHSADDEMYYQLALINYIKQKNPQEALENLSICIKLKPGKANYYYIKAILNKELKNYAAALPDFKNAIKYGKADPDYYNGSAYCNVQLDNFVAAYDDYSVALLLNAKDDYARSMLRKIDPVLQSEYAKMGFTPQNAFQFFMKIGDDYLQNDDKLHAALNYTKCTQVDAKNPIPYNKAGKIFGNYKMNNYAESFLRFAAYADGKNPEYFFDLGQFYVNNLNNYTKASGILDTAALLGSKNENTYFLNGVCKQFALDNANGAFKDYTAALTLRPNFTRALNARANLLMNKLNNYKLALADYETLYKLDPNAANKQKIQDCKDKLKE